MNIQRLSYKLGFSFRKTQSGQTFEMGIKMLQYFTSKLLQGVCVDEDKKMLVPLQTLLSTQLVIQAFKVTI